MAFYFAPATSYADGEPERKIVAATFCAAVGIYLVGRALFCYGPCFGGARRAALRPGVFTCLYFGQFALVAATYAASPLLGLISRSLAANFSLAWFVLPLAAGAGWLVYRRVTPGEALVAPTLLPVACAGIGAIGGLIVLYSWHIGPLGLDTQSHIYWSQQVMDAGRVGLVARGTGLVDSYTRGFHVLVAIWTAMGLAFDGLIGPMVKIQPFLQSFIPCAVVLELLLAWVGRRRAERPAARLLSWLGSALLLLFSLHWTRFVQPTLDLNGTPRCSATSLLALPLICLLASLAYRRVQFVRAALVGAPAALAFALVVNPCLGLGFLIFSLVACWTWACYRRQPGLRWAGRVRRQLWVLGLLVACGMLLQDPWVITKLSGAAPAAIDPLLAKVGLTTVVKATKDGLVTPTLPPRPTLCLDRRCLAQLAHSALRSAPAAWLGSAWNFPIVDGGFTKTSRRIYDLLLGGTVAAALACQLLAASLARRRRRLLQQAGLAPTGRRGPRRAASPVGGRLTATLAGGVVLVGLPHAAIVLFFKALGDENSHDLWLLGEYIQHQGQLATPFLFWLVLVAALTALAEGMASAWRESGLAWHPAVGARLKLALGRRAPAWPACASLVGLAALLYAPVELLRPWQSLGQETFHGRITVRDLKVLRKIEAYIQPGQLALVPAIDAVLGGEHFVLPTGIQPGIMAFARGPFVFNLNFGSALAFTWRDLEAGICQADAATARRFLSAKGITWVYVRAADSKEAQFMQQKVFCSRQSLADLGAVYPPVFSARGQSLYRVSQM